MSRPPTGAVYAISKLPSRKPSSDEKEAMNCKSCRKRKIKCSRTRPKCNSCDVFHCECIYDAVPRKRGPKTEVLEELLKRIDGLEKRIEDGKTSSAISDDPKSDDNRTNEPEPLSSNNDDEDEDEIEENVQEIDHNINKSNEISRTNETRAKPKLPRRISVNSRIDTDPGSKHINPALSTPGSFVPDSDTSQHGHRMSFDKPLKQTDDAAFIAHLVNVFFQRVQAKPYAFIHEKTLRVRIMEGSCPAHLLHALCAVSVRYTLPPSNMSLSQSCEEFARLSKEQLDVDEPSIDNLQTLMLLCTAYFALGYGKRSFMLLGTTIRMCLALELHRELPELIQSSPIQREIRRRCFWSCYLMDRFAVCGSNRPPLINDSTIKLRLPCSEHAFLHGVTTDEPFFSEGGFGQHFNTSNFAKNTNALCVEIVQILGKTVLYTQHGGVKGDSHFPWHSSSNLSMIRNELKLWAANLDGNFERSRLHNDTEATTYFLYLKELSGTGTQQAWQMEATNMCLQHANALTELASSATKNTATEWPAFMSYCLTSAATVLVHGTQYVGHVFSSSSKENLLRVMRYLIKMRRQWAVINHQCSTIRRIHLNHVRLTKGYANDPKYLDDFFDRYDDAIFDTSYIPFRFLNDFSDDTLINPDDLFADPTLSEIYHSPVPSVETPGNSLPSPTSMVSESLNSNGGFDDYMRNKQMKRRRIQRASSSSSIGLPNTLASDLKQIQAQNKRHLGTYHHTNSSHHSQYPPPTPMRSNSHQILQNHQAQPSPKHIPFLDDTSFRFSPMLSTNNGFPAENQNSVMSPSDNYSFFNSNPYSNLFDFDPSAAFLNEDFSMQDVKDSTQQPPPTEIEPDPLMMLLSEMAQQEDPSMGYENGNNLDIFMGSSSV